jgi:hypothetical protein
MPLVPLISLDIDNLPSAEDDAFEYKSSATPLQKLNEKISRAASAFANSGGGCFIAGVSGNGTPDGGLSAMVGRQSLRDWVDQAIATVSPPVAYDVRLFDGTGGKGQLAADNVILAITFFPSESAPHMADDKKYYIRAGAHSVPASNFIVESLWARRGSSKPLLSHAVRERPGNPDVVQIGVIALNSSPAIDVELKIEPLTGILNGLAKRFPIRLPVVDRNTPFFLDVGMYYSFARDFPTNTVVMLKYRDVAGNEYTHQSGRPLTEAINPIRIGTDHVERIAKAIEKLSK